MQGQAADALSPLAQRRLSMIAAASIAAIAILLAVLIALRKPQYEAQARLAYSASGSAPAIVAAPASVSVSAPGLPSGTGVAPEVASRILTDAQLATLIAEYDLYPKLRQTKTSRELVERLRGQLKFSEPEPGVLEIAFRDTDQAKTRALTNGVAALLGNYEVATSVPAAVTPSSGPGKSRHRGREIPKATLIKPRPIAPAAVTAQPASGQEVARLSHEVDRVDSTLSDMAAARVELVAQQRQVETKISDLEKTEHKAATAEGRVGAQDGAHERTVLEQQITVEKAKLADLRNRYTEEYPDVQREESVLADLQSRLARIPDTAAALPAASANPSPAMQRLKQEQQRVQDDLSRNADQTAVEQSRRSELLLQMQQARTSASHPGPLQVPMASPVPEAPAPAQSTPGATGPMITVRIQPFRLIETAGPAGLVGTSQLALSVWLALGTLVLVALCFAPLVPAHYTAVVESAEDLQQNVPEHVTYLGDVGRTEP